LLKFLLEEYEDYYFANKCFDVNNNNNNNNDIFSSSLSPRNNCQNNFIRKYFKFNSEELFTSKFQKDQKFPEKLNMNTTEFLESFDIMLKYSEEVNPNKNIDAPNVPTSVIYGSFLDTKTAYVYNHTQNLTIFPAKQIYFYGGDGTVTTYGSLLPALKWIYDNNHIKKSN
jgi:hypothetical protein